MTPQELKNSILNMAVQGRLVQQDPSEGTAEELYLRIQEEKKRLIKEGKIKKERPLPEIAEEEIPFEIPESWKWCRMNNVLQLIDGNKNDKQGILLDARYLRGKSEARIVNSGKYVHKGDDIILVDGENSGEVFTAPSDGYMGSTFKQIWITKVLDKKFVLYNLLIYKEFLRKNKKGAAIPHLNKDLFYNITIGLPPLPEQHRIVAKLEQILPLVDRYAEAWEKLEALNKRFPEDMKKSLLQMAVQGKLVQQDPSEGTAEELYQKIKNERSLPEITDEEIPFEIPDSWKWVPLGMITSINGGFAFKSSNYSMNGVRVIRISDFNEDGFINTNIVRHPYNEEYDRFLLETNNIILCMTGGTVGKSYFVKEMNEPMLVNQRVATIKVKEVLPNYIYYNIISPLIQQIIKERKNSTNDNISMETICRFPIPLPPLPEQHRIVAKLEELLPLCEKLGNG